LFKEKLFQTGALDRQVLDDIRTQVELACARVGVHELQIFLKLRLNGNAPTRVFILLLT